MSSHWRKVCFVLETAALAHIDHHDSGCDWRTAWDTLHAAFITEAELQMIAGVELFLQRVVLTVQRLVFAGVVHWAPPEGALDLAAELIRDKGVSAYGPCAGLPALAGALRQKLASENGLPGVSSAKPCSFRSFLDSGQQTW